MQPFFINTGDTFDIYSMGDGLYMQHIMNGVAALSNSGFLVGLGLLGFVCGLLLIGFKGVATGLQKIEIGFLFVAFLVFTMMFGMKCRVVIHDLGGAPGTTYAGVYAVDNVPFGLAVAGHFISTLSYDITKKMQTGFGTPTQSSPDGVSGFGRSLEWLNSVRNWNLPALTAGPSSPYLSNVLKNQVSYIKHCTMIGAKSGKLSMALANNVKDPWSHFGTMSTGGLGLKNAFLMFPFVNNDGSVTDWNCKAGFAKVAAQVKSSKLYTDFAKAVTPRAKVFQFQDGVAATQQLNNAMAAIGGDAQAAQRYVRLSSTLVAENIAHAMGDSATGMDVMTGIMMQQAMMQRNTQWAANESMFRSIIRPMTAFFESMIYAVAPFMAFLIGFGAWGIQMIVRYLILTIWVGLWLPVLSICNLFEVTMANHGYKAMMIAASQNGSDAMPIGSLAATQHLQTEVANWLSTGAMLAASTPAITLMLIFGGAMTATSLANRLQGGDMVNEKLDTPDTVKPGAAQDVQPLSTTSIGSGTMSTGTLPTAPSFSSQDVYSRDVQSARQQMHQAAESYNKTVGSSLGAQAAQTLQQAATGTNSLSHQSQIGIKQTAQWGRSIGLDVNSRNSRAFAAFMSLATSGNIGAAAQMLGKIGASLGIDKGTRSTKEIASSLAAKASQTAGKSNDVSVSSAWAVQGMMQSQSSSGSSLAKSASSSEQWQSAEQSLDQSAESYRTTEAHAQSMGTNQQMKVPEVSQSLLRSGNDKSTYNAAIRDYGRETLRANEAYLASGQAGWAPKGQRARRAAAAVMAFAGIGPGKSYESDAKGNLPDQRLRDTQQMLSSAGFMSNDAMSADANSNQDVASGVDNTGLQGEVNSRVGAGESALGTPSSAEGVAGTVKGNIQDGGQHNGNWQTAANLSGVDMAQVDGVAVHAAQDVSKAGMDISHTSGSALVDHVSNKHTGALQSANKEYKQAQQKAQARIDQNDLMGGIGVAGAAHNGITGIGELVTGEGYDATTSALNIAANYDNMSDQQRSAAFFMHDEDARMNAIPFTGITNSSIMDNLNDPETISQGNASFNAHLSKLRHDPETRMMNPDLQVAMAAVAATKDNDGSTRMVAQRYEEAYSRLNPSEQNTVNDFTAAGSDDPTTVSYPLSERMNFSSYSSVKPLSGDDKNK